jgi:hypothetical protein
MVRAIGIIRRELSVMKSKGMVRYLTIILWLPYLFGRVTKRESVGYPPTRKPMVLFVFPVLPEKHGDFQGTFIF